MKTFTPLPAAGLAAALLTLCAFLVPQTAQAQDPGSVIFTAPTAGQSVTVGTSVFFDADFTNPTTSTYVITDATFTSTDLAVNAEVADGQIAAFFDGADGMGDPFTVAPSPPDTLVPGVFELDLDSTLPPGQTISGLVGFDGYDASDPNQTPIEFASQSFSVVTAAPSGTAAPEPPSVAAVAFTGLFAAGLMLRARRRKAASCGSGA